MATVINHDGPLNGPPPVPEVVPDAKAAFSAKAFAVREPTISVSQSNHGSNTQRLSPHITGREQHGLWTAPGPGLDEQPVATARSGDLQTAAAPSLSKREKQIIDGLIKGQSNKIIGRAFGIAEATVKVHMKAILRKLPCSNRTQVAIWALGHIDVFGPRMNGASMALSLGLAK
jgi:DNA-binding CsgD family transcriptional regulator